MCGHQIHNFGSHVVFECASPCSHRLSYGAPPSPLTPHRPLLWSRACSAAPPSIADLEAPPLHPRLRVMVCAMGTEKRRVAPAATQGPIHPQQVARDHAQPGGRGGCNATGAQRLRLRPPGEDWRRLGLHLCCSGSQAAPRRGGDICRRFFSAACTCGDRRGRAVVEASDFLIEAKR